jgi:hypothetical protein
MRPRRLSVGLFNFIHLVFIVFIDLLEVLSCEVAKDIKKIDKVVENAGLFFGVVPVRLK